MNGRSAVAREMAARVAADLEDGMCVNLGIGLPVLVADADLGEREIIFHSENGLIGMGPAPQDDGDPDLINASKQRVSLLPGGAIVHHTDSFVLMRGGHIDVSVLGAFEVSRSGDLANWSLADETVAPAIGGAMDLAVGARKVFVMMTHTARDGIPKLRRECRLPLTAARVVSRIYTDLATIDVSSDHLSVSAIAAHVSREELQRLTDAPLQYADDVRVFSAGADAEAHG